MCGDKECKFLRRVGYRKQIEISVTMSPNLKKTTATVYNVGLLTINDLRKLLIQRSNIVAARVVILHPMNEIDF
jgi:hypothetical protein